MTNTQPPDHTATIAGLARQIEAHEHVINDLTTLPGRVEQLHNVLQHLIEERGPKPTDDPPGAVTWLGFDGDTDTARTILTDLIEWLETVYLQWPDGAKTLPVCWMWHPWIVEELVWLRAAWLHAYGSNARPTDPGDWCDRQRPGVARRIKTLAGNCNILDHQPGEQRCVPAPKVTLTNAVKSIATWWTTDRTSPGPTPTHEQLQAEQLNTTTSR